METQQTIYPAGYVAERLGISQAMLRRYARTLEDLTGERVYSHPRDGRQYTQAQLDTLLSAKGLVESNPGMKVEEALKLALGQSKLSVMARAPSLQGMTPDDVGDLLRAAITQPLQAALQAQQQAHKDDLKALQDASERDTQAVLDELRQVRAELAALREANIKPRSWLQRIWRQTNGR